MAWKKCDNLFHAVEKPAGIFHPVAALANLRAALWQESIQMSEVSRQNVAMGRETVQRLLILNSGF
jgi:hypothetical protein